MDKRYNENLFEWSSTTQIEKTENVSLILPDTKINAYENCIDCIVCIN